MNSQSVNVAATPATTIARMIIPVMMNVPSASGRHATPPSAGLRWICVRATLRGMVTFKLEKDGKGYHAWSPELPGAHTHGATRTEALENLKDAVRLYLDDVMEESLM